VVTPVADGDLLVEPTSLSLRAWVGTSTSGTVTLTNTGKVTRVVPVEGLAPPFSGSSSVEVGGGSSVDVAIGFTPTAPGTSHVDVSFGGLVVALDGEARAVPPCQSEVCRAGRFDFTLERCVLEPMADGTACGTRCVSGQCRAGTCIGTAVSCDDDDACTIDACDEARGCQRSARACPQPVNRCLVGACDAQRGCIETPVADGTVCGRIDCLADTAEICLNAQCVVRSRPQGRPCANTWYATDLFTRRAHSMALDEARGEVVLFGGIDQTDVTALSATWTWDGARWRQHFPRHSPPPQFARGLSWDGTRGVVALFGEGSDGGESAWEWDGTDWAERASLPFSTYASSASWDPVRRETLILTRGQLWRWKNGLIEAVDAGSPAPSPRQSSLVFDAARGEHVLFGGMLGDTTRLGDTWTFDGFWRQRTVATAPTPRVDYAVAFDAARGEVVLFGGYTTTSPVGDTWTWSGTGWTQRQAAGPRVANQHAMAWDAPRQRVLLAGGPEAPLLGTWDWDGTTWAARADAGGLPAAGASLTWDSTRNVAIAVGGGDFGAAASGTWEWDGASWRPLALDGGPGPRVMHSLGYDPARRRVVLYGGYGPGFAGAQDDTWEFDGAAWRAVTPDGGGTPGPNANAPMTYDPVRGELLMFGGGGSGSDLLWAWNGHRWSYRGAVTRPPARFGGWMTWDPRRGVAVLTGGRGTTWLDDVWEWDGVTWREVTSAPTGIAGPVVFDSARQAVLFMGRRETSAWDGTTFRPLGIGRTPGSDTWRKYAVYDGLRERALLLWAGETWGLASR
jgi:hypothetical protein